MNLKNLKKQLIIDEGCRLEVYLDKKGLPTMGIGHLLTKKDPELMQWQIGQKASKKFTLRISQEYCDQLFEKDVQIACDSCKKLIPEFDLLLEEVQEIITNMMFNIGYSRLAGFIDFLKAIHIKNWKEAAKEMIDSKWYREVGNRAKRLVIRMQAIN